MAKMRADALGMFWEDLPPVKVSKTVKFKPTPPDPVWLAPDYLPGLEEATRFDVPLMTDEDLYNIKGDTLVYDIECYTNYFLIAFKSKRTGKVTYAEMRDGEEDQFNKHLVSYLVENCHLVGFYSNGYDRFILTLALLGADCATLKDATNRIIAMELNGHLVLRAFKTGLAKMDHSDIMEVAPLRAGLKAYSGRFHARRMQDLPFHPETYLSEPQITITRYYCVNDLENTMGLIDVLAPEVKLREKMSAEYGVDLRSKSDAQIAEAIISKEIEERLGVQLNPRELKKYYPQPGHMYQYHAPPYIRFQTDLLNWVFNTVKATPFIISEYGNIGMPEQLADMKIAINGSVYRMGIGGLHSSESKAAHVASKHVILSDRDVTSFYPWLILNMGLFPPHLGPTFLDVYRSIVERRIEAKISGDKSTATSLKIVVNGSYGKLGSVHSILYAPQLLIQVTITGQLLLLMLIERLELAGIPVVSANTDGIVIKCPSNREADMNAIVKQWEVDTSLETEESRYLSLYSRDVNNYIAVKADQDKDGNWLNTPPDKPEEAFKTKGAYANPWRTGKYGEPCLHKNPTNTICVEAIENLLYYGKPIEATIRECEDIRKFVTVRSVKHGAVKLWTPPETDNKAEQEALVTSCGFTKYQGYWLPEGADAKDACMSLASAYKLCVNQSDSVTAQYLGKSIRWYYANGAYGPIVTADKGSRVPNTDGAKPCMDLPDSFPNDVNYEWYIDYTNRILKEIAYSD